jgi:putative transposase
VMLNPVRARLVKRAEDWQWSCARALLGIEPDALTSTALVRAIWPDVAAMLDSPPDKDAFDRLRQAETIGRPVGDAAFMTKVEALTGRRVTPGKRGPRAKVPGDVA